MSDRASTNITQLLIVVPHQGQLHRHTVHYYAVSKYRCLISQMVGVMDTHRYTHYCGLYHVQYVLVIQYGACQWEVSIFLYYMY